MAKQAHLRLSDLRGLHRLANDATLGLTDLVEDMHATIAPRPGTGITRFVYRSVRHVTRIVGGGLDTLIGALAPLIAERPSSQEREAMVAALNGVLGDYLENSGNPLAIAMELRPGATPPAPGPRRKLAIFAHGLCMNPGQWKREGHDHGAALARDLGYTPLYLQYNSGRHIADNGRELAERLEALLAESPADELAIIGHSMGGLVARSACHFAQEHGHRWLARLDAMVLLGTPHYGAPLARAGTLADFLAGISPYTIPFARLARVRSAGINDLVHPGPMFELPGRVRCYAVAASRQPRPRAADARLRGDGLVPVKSALGMDPDPRVDLGLPEANRFVVYDAGHFDLLSSAKVYARLKAWLEEPRLRRNTAGAAPASNPPPSPRNR